MGYFFHKENMQEISRNFNMLYCNVVATMMNINQNLCRDDDYDMKNWTSFRSFAVGLNFLSHTRPNIAFSIGVITRFMHNLSELHLGAAKRVLRYIAGTQDHGILYSKVTLFESCSYWRSYFKVF